MAITVTPNLTDISLCDATTGWAGGQGYLAIDGDVELQGNYCLSDWVDATLQTVVKYTFPAGATDLTGMHLFIWVYCSGQVDTKANGGYQIYAETDASNYSYWYVGGSDTHGGGWQLMVCDISASRDDGAGTLNVGSITKVGIRFKTTTPAPIKGQTRFNNVFWDAFRYGTGLTITSGATDQISMEDIFTVDDNKTNKYGVITKSAGAYVVQGKLIFGSDSSGDIDFEDTNQVILFPNNDKVGDSFYGIQVLGNSGGTTNFYLGEKSGSSGVSGCFIKASGSKKFSFDVGDVDIDLLGLYGTTFANAGVITLPSYSTTREMLNCSITTSGEVIVNTCIVENCNFISADANAILLSDDTNYMSDCFFIDCVYGIEIDTDGSYSFDNLQFIGNTYDVNNTSGSALEISLINTPVNKASTYTGTAVTYTSDPVTTKITVKDVTTLADIQDARVLLEAADATGPLNFEESVSIVRSGTTVTVTHTGHGLETGDLVHIKGCNEYQYNGVWQITYISVDSYSFEIASTPNSPATGSPTSTTVIFNDLTNASGYVSDTRVFSSDQPVVGRARKSSGSPLYKSQPISGTISSSSGLDNITFLIKDE